MTSSCGSLPAGGWCAASRIEDSNLSSEGTGRQNRFFTQEFERSATGVLLPPLFEQLSFSTPEPWPLDCSACWRRPHLAFWKQQKEGERIEREGTEPQRADISGALAELRQERIFLPTSCPEKRQASKRSAFLSFSGIN
ncbi:hypothetical protein [uncultured Mitsuokella sp.]|uniref:hypothetical protein n=1 Tax=uncultured Mitsuokella sp. TaxID=453120 RepID=UPI002591B981|nr:hypothetical protein [uncultured Mitsuokella sp.]